jgi:hypothetical protein
MHAERKRILILCKTYPSPSSKHVETSCVAGMEESGRLIRLYPVPFRLVADEQQFKKWQWIRARVRKASEDRRAESYRISVDTIDIEGEPLSTKRAWQERRAAIASLEVFDSFDALEEARQVRGVSLALLQPTRIADLLISSADSPEWTADEVAKLLQAQAQASLFDRDAEQRSLKILRKLPFDFHYRYECRVSTGETKTFRHKIVDWEAGALYWNIQRQPDWQAAFRQKFFDEFREKDLLFLMGTIHRFPNQWLIVSVLYPPKPSEDATRQAALF